jgi:large subunit ribosomal protein L25
MAELALQAQLRTVMGKRVRRLRQQGLIPGNIYGRGVDSVPVQLEVRALRDILLHAGTTTVVDVHVASAAGAPEGAGGDDGKAHPVLIERVSRHPTSGTVLHVDLRQVDLNRPVRAAVPIVLSGEAPAVAQGGVLVQSLDAIDVEALPRALPQSVEVDVSGLADVDEQVTVGDLRLPPGVSVNTDSETVIVRIVASRL